MHYLKFEGITKLFIKVGSNNLIKILFIQTKVNGIPYKMNILFVCLVTMLAFSHYIFIACLIFRCDSIVSLLFFCTQNECKSLKRHYQCQQKFAFNYMRFMVIIWGELLNRVQETCFSVFRIPAEKMCI